VRILHAFALVVATMWATTPAGAIERGKPLPAIALYDQPKYGPDFTHFDYVNPDAPKGGTFVRKNEAFLTFDTFNPFTLKGAAALELGLMHDPLMAGSLDEPASLYGLIAKTVEVAPDNSWVQFAVNPAARFSDGSAITAADVVFSFNILVTKGSPQYRIQYADVAKAEVVGPGIARFIFKTTKNRELPILLAALPVLSEKFWKDRDFAATTLDIPVTSGAYTIESFDVGRYVTYKHVADYWPKDLPVMRGQNNFDRVRIEYFRDDTVSFEGFKTNAYDIIRVVSASQWMRRFDFSAVLDGRVKKLEVSSIQPQDATGIVLNLRRPMFQDRRVREALNWAFDYESLNKNLFYGLYARLRSYWQGSPLEATGLPSPAEIKLLAPFRDKLPPEVFTQEYKQPLTAGAGDNRDNLLKARVLLQAAGWTMHNGQLVDAAGHPFTFEITLVQEGLERVIAPWVQALKRLGITASIRLVDTSQYANRVNAYDFDAIYIGINNSLAPGNEQLDSWSTDAADRQGASNYSGVKDPAVDALIRHIIEAETYGDLTTATRALDRVLTWNYYRLLTYTSPVDRYAYWQKLKMPDVMPSMGLGRMGSSAVTLWWEDPTVSSSQTDDAVAARQGPSKVGALAWVIALAAIGFGIWRLRRGMGGRRS